MKKLLVFLVLLSTAAVSGGEPVRKHADQWLGRDKALHFSFSLAAACGLAYGYQNVVRTGRNEGLVLAGCWSIALGVAKEDHDNKVKKTFFSFKDLAVDMLGVGAGLLIAAQFR